MTTVLITAIGGDIAQSVARLVHRRFPDFRLIGTDMSAEHGGTLFVDRLEIVPAAANTEYSRRLISIIEEERVDYVVPMSEAELAVLLPFIEARQHTHWITAGATVIRAGIDKLETARAIERMGLPAPWTVLAGPEGPPALPCILKNRFGSGSRGVYTLTDMEDVRYHAPKGGTAVFQELLPDADREVTCAVYRTRDGRVAHLQMRRRLVGGFTGWAVVINEPDIATLCEKLASQLDLTGAMNVQLRMTSDGPRVFEINPRYSSTALMRHEIGFADVAWAFDEAQGRRVSFPSIAAGTVIVRTQGAAVVPTMQSRYRRAQS